MQAGLLTAAFWATGLLAWSAPAAAKDLFILDSQAASPGNVIEDGAGTAYVGWIHKSGSLAVPDPPMFCKIPVGGTCTNPITLPIPGATSTSDEVSGVFPVFGTGSTIYVVGPRYVDNDVVVWTSTNGGESFNAGTIDKKGYSGKTAPSSALLEGANLIMGGSNAGLGFSSTPAAGGSGVRLDSNLPVKEASVAPRWDSKVLATRSRLTGTWRDPNLTVRSTSTATGAQVPSTKKATGKVQF